ncbi:tRNA-processing RNAse BN [Cricetibacter osteomyelitidis]|uniref:UPF0761 membrane protein EDC44_1365 n=1 Tax=Cricetibacter osteomyelitidis TaxID=1521931 RepID=A0A4R2SME0_9PAST|nr:virulence factor BrkB family protein [Cricetibacter osteomyelitidis]TCP91189.1 tRNA-processing RNAse BN [Cricetibacter osteomyelitidis]
MNTAMLFLRTFWHRFNQNKLTQAAGYLTYSTMLAIVPLIMVVFSVFAAFPVFSDVTVQIKQFIFTNFAPSASDTVGQYIDEFVNNTKQMSAVGIVSLVVVALMLINSIDRTLNNIWAETRPRSIVFSFAIYWTILTLGPLFIGASTAVSTYIHTFTTTLTNDFSLPFGLEILRIIPFLLTWLSFTLIYQLVPNTKVNIKHAAVGALVAAVFFTLGKQAFGWYIVTFPSYQLIYGAMATLPIMLLWLQLSWIFILLGAQLAAVIKEVRLIQQENLTALEQTAE